MDVYEIYFVWLWSYSELGFNMNAASRYQHFVALILFITGSQEGQIAGCCECGNEPNKMQGISWLAKKLLASQEGLCSMELVS